MFSTRKYVTMYLLFICIRMPQNLIKMSSPLHSFITITIFKVVYVHFMYNELKTKNSAIKEICTFCLKCKRSNGSDGSSVRNKEFLKSNIDFWYLWYLFIGALFLSISAHCRYMAKAFVFIWEQPHNNATKWQARDIQLFV